MSPQIPLADDQGPPGENNTLFESPWHPLCDYVCVRGSHPVLGEAETLVWQWDVVEKHDPMDVLQERLVLSDASLRLIKSWRLPSPCLAGLRPAMLGSRGMGESVLWFRALLMSPWDPGSGRVIVC